MLLDNFLLWRQSHFCAPPMVIESVLQEMSCCSFIFSDLALKTSWLSLPEVTFVMVTFPCWSPHFILLLSHSWWFCWELPQLWCLFYKTASPSRCWGVAESSYRKPFCLCLIRKSTFQGDSEIRFDWLWALLFVITNSLLRKGCGSHPSHSKIGGFGLTALGWKSQGVASLFRSGRLAVDSLKQKADQCLYKMSRAGPQCQAWPPVLGAAQRKQITDSWPPHTGTHTDKWINVLSPEVTALSVSFLCRGLNLDFGCCIDRALWISKASKVCHQGKGKITEGRLWRPCIVQIYFLGAAVLKTY